MADSPPRDLHEIWKVPPPLDNGDPPVRAASVSLGDSSERTSQGLRRAASSPTMRDIHRASSVSTVSAQEARPVAMARLRDGQHRPRCRGAHISPTGARTRHIVSPENQVVDTLEDPPPLVIVSCRAIGIHLTKLRSSATHGLPFRATADRVIRLLLEEALAWAPIRRVQIGTGRRAQWSGVSTILPACAMVMDERGYPLLEGFRTIQPDAPTGFMTLERDNSNGSWHSRGVVLRRLCAPVDFQTHNTFLLDAVCASASEACVAIRSLLDAGALESRIFFVTLVISATAAAEIAEAFPSAHVVTAAVVPEPAPGGEALLGLGNFQERYFETTTIRHSNQGSVVDV